MIEESEEKNTSNLSLKYASGAGNTLTLPGLNNSALLLGYWGSQILLWSQSSQTWAVELLFILYRKVMKILQNPILCLRGRRRQTTNGRRWDNGCADLGFAVIDGQSCHCSCLSLETQTSKAQRCRWGLSPSGVAFISYQILEGSIRWGEKLFFQGEYREWIENSVSQKPTVAIWTVAEIRNLASICISLHSYSFTNILLRLINLQKW